MYMVANRVSVAPDWGEEFEGRFRQRAGQVDKQAGFVRMQILRPADDKSPYVVLTTWENEMVFNDWVGSEDFKLAHQNPLPKEAFNGESGLERYEVVITAEAMS